MYKDIGGESLTIGQDDIVYTVHLPPMGKGYYYNMVVSDGEYSLIEDVQDTDVIVRSEDPKECYWERPLRPQNYDQRVEQEKRRQKIDSHYYDPDLETYRRREWKRRRYGVWFANYNPKKNKLEYIYLTGMHYLYLTHWPLDVGYPKFRITNRDVFYWMGYFIEDPNSMGGVELTKRRDGKTFRAGLFLFDYISQNKRVHGGIQSKTGDDAKKNVFFNAVVQPFRKMIDTFVPTFDKSKGSAPTQVLSFFRTNRRGELVEPQEEELGSWIDWESSKEIAYDGKKLHRYVSDECFKLEEADIYKRHEVIAPCLTDDEKIIGKALYTSTVEEMNPSQIESARQLWADSDINIKNENNRTLSGLYRWFTPAYKTMFYDKYGYGDEDKAMEYFLNQRKALADSPRKLASYIRKHPFKWEEAFRTEGETCLFNSLNIDNRLDVLTFKKGFNERGNFKWVEPFKSVKWVKDEHHGKWRVNWLPKEEFRNQIKDVGGVKYPARPTFGIIGIDPYDHNQTVDGGGSKGAGVAVNKYDDIDSRYAQNIVSTYLARPLKSRIFYEDMLMMCIFYGYQAVIEDQKVGIINFFEEMGFYGYVATIDGKKGVSSSQRMKELIAEAIEEYVEDRCEVCDFVELLEDWKAFNLEKTQKYDLSMASGYALYGASQLVRRHNNIAKVKGGSHNSYFRKHNMKHKTL